MFRSTVVRTLTAATLLLAPTAAVVAVPAATTTATATAASYGTLAERNAYVRCVAPSTGVTLNLRIRLLSFSAKALEGIRAGVPAPLVTATLRSRYGLTTAEASRVYWCTVRVWGR